MQFFAQAVVVAGLVVVLAAVAAVAGAVSHKVWFLLKLQ
jgi:hypothetical protein